MLSGFCEEAEEPMARITDKETLLGRLKEGEAETNSLDLTPDSNWLRVEMCLAVGMLIKLCEIAIIMTSIADHFHLWQKYNNFKILRKSEKK